MISGGREWVTENKRALALLLVSACLFFILRATGFSASLAQFAVAPLVVIGVAGLTVLSVRVPRFALVLALAGSALSAAFLFVGPFGDRSRVLIAQFKGDALDKESLLLRSAIEARDPDLELKRFYRALADDADARSLLAADPSVQGVVWGTTLYAVLSLRLQDTISVAEISGLARERLGSLEVITSVPYVALSFEPRWATADFLGAVMRDLNQSHREQNSDVNLIEAVAIRAPWRGPAHRAFAWWAIGNLRLREALRGGPFELGEASCAIDAYQNAYKLLRSPNEHPELYSAVSNNLAVVYLLRSEATGALNDRQRGRALLLKARKALDWPRRLGEPVINPKVAARNLKRYSAAVSAAAAGVPQRKKKGKRRDN